MLITLNKSKGTFIHAKKTLKEKPLLTATYIVVLSKINTVSTYQEFIYPVPFSCSDLIKYFLQSTHMQKEEICF